jgi:uncharacterized caspase-like protein
MTIHPRHHPRDSFKATRSSHVAIAIGINHYARLQPLTYAQYDAQAMWAFWVKEVELPGERCLLMTDTSSVVQGQSTYPTKAAIQDWLSRLSQQAAPGDTVWFFFSGYGVCHQGQDYLMPIDGNPADIPGTGIALNIVVKHLQTVPGVRVIMLLDMNRSQAMQVGATVGSQALDLAQQSGICLVLSCQPDEFSHESNGHGLFTLTLLEGLRHPQCTTFQALERYLTVNLPKLGNHYLLPSQHPVVVIPRGLLPQQLLPTGLPMIPPEILLSSPEPPLELQDQLVGGVVAGSPPETVLNGTVSQGMYGAMNGLLDHGGVAGATMNGLVAQPRSFSNISPEPKSVDVSDVPDLPWSPDSLGLATPPVYAVRSNGTLEDGHQGSPSPTTFQHGLVLSSPPPAPEATVMNAANKPAEPTSQSTNVPEETDGKFWASLLMWGGVALVVLLVGVFWRNASGLSAAGGAKPGTPASPSPRQAISPGDGATSDLQRPADPALVMSFDALQNNQPDRAIALLDKLPVTEQQSQEYKRLRQQAEAKLSQMVLTEARVMVTPNQASHLRQAIDHLQTIQPDEPLYEQAQQDINRWSLVILDIAEGRVQKGDYAQGIAAAKLVPESTPDTYAQAQRMIARWQVQLQQQRISQAILQQAMARAKGNQASAYNSAIRIARQIRPRDPLFAEAEAKIAAWSRQILLIARSRAEEGKLRQAMAALQMVPADVAVTAEATRDIETLSQRLLTLAQQQAGLGNYRQAISYVSLIPPVASSYQEAQAAITKWQGM